MIAAVRVTNKDHMLAAVAQNGWMLNFAAPNLQADKEVVLAAVKQCGAALQFAAPNLRADKEVLLAASRNCGAAADRYEGHMIERMFQQEPEFAHLRSIMDKVTNPPLSHRERIVLALHLARGMDRFTQEEDLLRLILKTRAARKHGIVATDLYIENDDSPRTANVSVLFDSGNMHLCTCVKFTRDLDNPNSSWQVDD